MSKFLLGTILLVILSGCAAKLDKAIVGDWVADVEAQATTEDQKQAADMLRGLVSSWSLSIREDKSCTMTTMSSENSGTWTVSGDQLILDFGGEQVRGKIVDGGKKIELEMPQLPKNPYLNYVFVKK